MAQATDSYQDVLVDPQAQQQLADIYSATGPRPPTLPPPQPSYGAGPISPAPAPAPGPALPGFLTDAMSGLQKFGGSLPVVGMDWQQQQREQEAAAMPAGHVVRPILAPAVDTPDFSPVMESLRRGGPQDMQDAAANTLAGIAARERNARQLQAEDMAAERVAMTALGTDPRAAAKQIAALRAGGATEQEIAEFTQTMNAGRARGEAMVGPAGERIGMVTTANKEAEAGKLTRAIQARVGTEGVPLSQHPVFAEYGSQGPKGPTVSTAHGGDIGTATRAVMDANPDAIALLGDDFANKLIQNKIADVLSRNHGVPQEVIERGLGIAIRDGGAAAADATDASIIQAGRRSVLGSTVSAGNPELGPLVTAMQAAGATPEEIAAFVGRNRGLSLGTKLGAAPTVAEEAARPGELFPGIHGPGQAKILTQGERMAANDAAIAAGKPEPYPTNSLAGGTVPPEGPNSAQPPFGPERMPGDVQTPRQPPLRSGLAPHMTEAVVDETGKVVQKPRPVLINGQAVKQVELTPGFGETQASPTSLTSASFPNEPITANFDPKTGQFVAPADQVDALARQMRLQFPKDAPPPNVNLSVPEMISAMFRGYIVSNALSPFTLAIKAGADVIKMADTTVEAFSRGATNPAQIPGTVKALYGGFWRGITQDALAAFKNRQYSLGVEGQNLSATDRMLSGSQGPAAKRFAQAAEVASLGSPIPRTISALTAVFQRAYRDMGMYIEGYEAANKLGRTGAAADQYASAFMSRPLEFPGGKAALDRQTVEANTRTWTNSNPLSRIGGRDKPIIGDLLFTVTPFVNLVTNIAREGLEFIPGVGMAAKGAESLAKGGKITPAEWTRVVQHQFMGSVGTLILAQKAGAGEVTGDGPDDDNRRLSMIQAGWKPNHTKFGDNWYPNIAFGPLAPLLNFVGNTHDGLVYNTLASQRDSAAAKITAAAYGLVKGELDSAHWLDTLMDLGSAIHGSDAEKQNFIARYLGLFTPQSGSLKLWERTQEPATPEADTKDLSWQQAIAQRYFRQFPPALRPADQSVMKAGVPRADTGAAAAIPYLGTPGVNANFDGVGVPEGDPQYGKNAVLTAAQAIGAKISDWRKGGQIEPPNPTIGQGDEQIRLDPASAQAYIKAVGDMREKIVGATVFSAEYQNATVTQQKALFDQALSKADALAKSQFLAKGLIDETDPKMVVAQALNGFKAQQNERDQAYWIAALDRAGRLTPDVRKAIESSREALPGQKEFHTVDEYLTAAPLVHRYLSHVPYGTDAHPIGTPDDWQAVKDARTQASNLEQAYADTQSMPGPVAKQRAEIDVIQTLTPLQRQIFMNSSLITNPERKLMALKYGKVVEGFLGPGSEYNAPESGPAFANFPFNRP